MMSDSGQGRAFDENHPALKGDGSGGGKMTPEKLAQVLRLIDARAETPD